VPDRYPIEIVSDDSMLSRRLRMAAPRSATVPLRLVTTSQLPASAALAGSTRTYIVYASHPSAVEASVWLLAEASGYVTSLKSLAAAVAAVSDGEIWLDPHAAAALYRLIQMVNDSRWNSLAAASRAAAEGMSWSEACSALGLARTGALLSNLRTQILGNPS
jgi:hypothetical protein